MDNAPYHSVKLEKESKMSTLTKHIQTWLPTKGETWSPDMIEAKLLKIVPMTKHDGEKYRIDTIAAAAGRTVVRLPPYHCQLSPIELARGDMKVYVGSLNKKFKMAQQGPLVYEAINHVTIEKRTNFVRHVVDEEAALRKVDYIMD
ncbi:uncharacterized protein LOC120847826 [Ixodes scapularis]|uniref:uncharacterized protein LOC120847826 n=1 Tax=Ixodes scapularis TaxID=6945 RepID=UPI001C389189|nr:uncharacterized protein LOC120847826 [Ixodes scapularis]